MKDQNENFFHFLWEKLKQYKLAYLFGSLCIVLLNGTEMLPPLLLRNITDHLQKGTPLYFSLGWSVAIFFLCYAMIAFLRFVWRYLFLVSCRKIEFSLKRDLFDKIFSGNYSEISKLKVGSTVSLLSQDVEEIRMFTGPGILIFVDMVTYLIFVPLVILWVLGPAGIIPILPYLGIALFMPFYEKRVNRLHSQSSSLLGKLSDRIYEETIGIKVFRVLNLLAIRLSKFHGFVDKLFKHRFQASRLEILLDSLVNTLTYLSLSFVFLLAYISWKGNVGIFKEFAVLGNLVLALQLLNKLIWPMMAIAFMTNMLEKSKASYQRLVPLMKLATFKTGPQRIDPEIHSLKITNLSFKFSQSVSSDEAKKFHLHVASFRAAQGEKIGLVGEVGAGKSTLLKILATLYNPQEIAHFDEFQFNEISYEDLDVFSVREKLSYIPQETSIFNQTLLKNIAPYPDPDLALLDKCLDYAALKSDLEQFPEGVGTTLGERGVNLSGGQKQRVSIARSFYAQSSLYLWDDSISALDLATERKVIQALSHLNPKGILVLATHRPSALKNFDRIYVLHRGEIIEEGNFLSLMEKKGRFYYLYNLESATENLHLQEKINHEEAVL